MLLNYLSPISPWIDSRYRFPLRDYYDRDCGVVMKPAVMNNDPYGDGVWRSSWVYASLLILREKSPSTYRLIERKHGLNADCARVFINYFVENCCTSSKWKLPKHPDQKFSRDQLVPFLYFLSTVVKFAPEMKPVGKKALKSLCELEENGKPLSNSCKGKIGRNLGYAIDVLCDSSRYKVNYRTPDLDVFLITALGNITAAKASRRSAYKAAFTAALVSQDLAAKTVSPTATDSNILVDTYSHFNAIGLVTLQCLAWGKSDSDVKKWRKMFKYRSSSKWGPAFRIAYGVSANFEQFRYGHVAYGKSNNGDNDIVVAQRPIRFRSGSLRLREANNDTWPTLDWVILNGLKHAWD